MGVITTDPNGNPLGVSTNLPAGGGGDLTELVPWTTLGSGQASISLTSISGAHNDLILVAYLRTDRAANNVDSLEVRMNSDSGSNYTHLYRQSQVGSTSLQPDGNSTTRVFLSSCVTAANADANHYGHIELIFPNYASSTDTKKGQIHGSVTPLIAAQTDRTYIYGGFSWNSTSAITQIDLTPSFGTNFVTGCSYALYGLGTG